ncbi:MAG: hypothetical protein RMN52_00670 [Anaerolineae bacterium]|nr:hypothetical protein [Candidatus Roseilinea sp.]MDW8448490.1 hypothetical protein [Anaerolineae bacterium]
MNFRIAKPRSLIRVALAALASTALWLSPGMAEAKAGDVVVRGILTRRPPGKVGIWVVGGQSFMATARTQLDTDEGPLVVGACVKVKIRAGVVKEIDSEPAGDCR